MLGGNITYSELIYTESEILTGIQNSSLFNDGASSNIGEKKMVRREISMFYFFLSNILFFFILINKQNAQLLLLQVENSEYVIARNKCSFTYQMSYAIHTSIIITKWSLKADGIH